MSSNFFFSVTCLIYHLVAIGIYLLRLISINQLVDYNKYRILPLYFKIYVYICYNGESNEKKGKEKEKEKEERF